MFGWLGKVTRDARDRRAIERAKEQIRQRPSTSEMFRLHIGIVVAQNKIDGRRVRREYRRLTFWVLMIVALLLGIWANLLFYFIQPDVSVRSGAMLIYTAQVGVYIAFLIWLYVMITIYIPAFRIQKMVEFFGVSRRPLMPPLWTEYPLLYRHVPSSMFVRCYARTSIALKRRPYNGGFGIKRGFVDEEFTRRLMVELEHEQLVLIRTAARLTYRRLLVLALSAPMRTMSRRGRRRIERRRWAHSRKVNRIKRPRQPSAELREVFEGYMKPPSE